MNANAKKWIEALRSGAYEQASEALRRGDGFCCLGVACDLYAKEHPEMLVRRARGRYEYTYGRAKAFLPHSVCVWLGMRFSPSHKHGVNEIKLTGLNDKGYSFKEIAGFIESNQADMFE